LNVLIHGFWFYNEQKESISKVSFDVQVGNEMECFQQEPTTKNSRGDRKGNERKIECSLKDNLF